MKKIIITVSFIMVMVLAFALVAFAEAPKVTVSFDSDGGTEVKAIEVLPGSKLPEPPAPTREYYDFAGWYVLKGEEAELKAALEQAEKDGIELTEKDLAALKAVDENDEAWSFIGYVVTEDITLVAKWVPNGEMPPMDFSFDDETLDNFTTSLGYMGKGMVGIFVVTLVIIGVVAILNWHGRSLEKRNERKENK